MIERYVLNINNNSDSHEMLIMKLLSEYSYNKKNRFYQISVKWINTPESVFYQRSLYDSLRFRISVEMLYHENRSMIDSLIAFNYEKSYDQDGCGEVRSFVSKIKKEFPALRRVNYKL